MDFDRNFPLQATYENLVSTKKYGDHIDQYIQEELKYRDIYGPFKKLQFPVHVSPLMTRAEQNSDKCVARMDPNWPKGATVNNAIHKFKY